MNNLYHCYYYYNINLHNKLELFDLLQGKTFWGDAPFVEHIKKIINKENKVDKIINI